MVKEKEKSEKKKEIKKSPPSKKPEKKMVKKVVKKPIKKVVQSSKIIRWRAPDYYTFERSPYWSLIIGLASMILSLILIYTGNFFPVIIIILAVIITFQVSHEKPKTHEFAVDESGILSREVYIPFFELKSFWIASHAKKPILYIEPVGYLKSPIPIPLAQQNTFEVKNFLLRYLPERLEYGEMMSEKLIRLFRL